VRVHGWDWNPRRTMDMLAWHLGPRTLWLPVLLVSMPLGVLAAVGVLPDLASAALVAVVGAVILVGREDWRWRHPHKLDKVDLYLRDSTEQVVYDDFRHGEDEAPDWDQS